MNLTLHGKMEDLNYHHLMEGCRFTVFQNIKNHNIVFCECNYPLYILDRTYSIPHCSLFCKNCRNVYLTGKLDDYEMIEWDTRGRS